MRLPFFLGLDIGALPFFFFMGIELLFVRDLSSST